MQRGERGVALVLCHCIRGRVYFIVITTGEIAERSRVSLLVEKPKSHSIGTFGLSDRGLVGLLGKKLSVVALGLVIFTKI